MSEYILDVLTQTSKLDWVFPFQRTGAFPLDRSSLFSSLADAEAYAAGIPEGGVAGDERKLAGTSYVGQTVSVYDADANVVTLYIIDTDRSLKEVGSASLGDNASIEIIDGKIQLKDFGIGYYAYVPSEKDEEGNVITPSSYEYTEGFKAGLEPRVVANDEGDLVIAWYEPGTETVEDIAANVESVSKTVDSLDEVLNAEGGLVDQVEDLQEEIGHAADDAGNAATGLYKAIEDLESSKANIEDVYSKEDADKAIADAVAAAAHLQRTIVDVVEDINPLAEGAENFIYLVPTGLQEDDDKYDEYMVINGTVEKVGSWEVNLSSYAKTEYVDAELKKKVDATEGSRLMTDVEGAKLEGIEDGAQKNYISSVDVEFDVDLNGKLSLTSVPLSKVSELESILNAVDSSIDALETALGKKVDVLENHRLMSEAEGNKLALIKDLIQEVDDTKFTIDENGKLLLNSIEINEITGLEDKFATKVDKVEGSRLITDIEAQKLAKLSLDDSGNLGVSGTVNIENVQGLEDWLNINAATTPGLSEKNLTAELHEKLVAQLLIKSVNTTQLDVTNGHLSIKAVESDKVLGLTDLLAAKADDSKVETLSTKVNTLETSLNDHVTAAVSRFEAIEDRLIWHGLE